MTTPYASEAFLHQILGKALAAGASDVHLKVGQPPGARVHGDLVFFRGDKIRPDDTAAAARILLGAGPGRPAADRLEGPVQLVFPYEASGVGRFRVSAFRQRGALSLAMRSIPAAIPKLSTLGLPTAITSAMEPDRGGLVLLAGAAGAGKSTTAAALIGAINERSARHVITFEDPIEHLHEDRLGIVSQQAVGVDTPSVAEGLRAALRNDADVLYVAHLADAAALEAAIDAADLGRLVLAAVAAPDIARAFVRLSVLGRAVPAFATRFPSALRGALGQRLVRRSDGGGLVPVYEALIATTAVREVLRADEHDGAVLAPALGELMEQGASSHGTQTFDMHLEMLAAKGVLGRAGGT